jgi:hypothetical protein
MSLTTVRFAPALTPLAGASRIADGDGRFEFTAVATAECVVTLRVSKDGFETTSTTATWRRVGGDGPAVWARLHSLDPPLAFDGGNYTLTISLDLATGRGFPATPLRPEITCLGLPADFDLTVAGEVAAVNMESMIAEAFPGHRYLFIGGGPVPTRFTIDSGAVHLPFAADFRYCELTSERNFHECSQVPLERVVRQHWCRSDDVMLTFRKR